MGRKPSSILTRDVRLDFPGLPTFTLRDRDLTWMLPALDDLATHEFVNAKGFSAAEVARAIRAQHTEGDVSPDVLRRATARLRRLMDEAAQEPPRVQSPAKPGVSLEANLEDVEALIFKAIGEGIQGHLGRTFDEALTKLGLAARERTERWRREQALTVDVRKNLEREEKKLEAAIERLLDNMEAGEDVGLRLKTRRAELDALRARLAADGAVVEGERKPSSGLCSNGPSSCASITRPCSAATLSRTRRRSTPRRRGPRCGRSASARSWSRPRTQAGRSRATAIWPGWWGVH